MKVFIYRQLLNEQVLNWYGYLFQQNAFSLNHHHHWFNDILATLSPFETNDPDEADYFFIPLLVVPFQFLNSDITPMIQQCAHLDRGRHILFMSGDFGQRAKSPYESHHEGRAYRDIYPWLDQRFVLIALESTRDLLPSDIAIPPYQIEFKPAVAGAQLQAGPDGASLPVDVSLMNHRLLYSFCGAISYDLLPQGHIRGPGGIERKAGHGEDWFIGTSAQAAEVYGPVWGSNRVMMARALFTLCPAGYGRWSFRWIEALLSGSIPVLLADGYELPFSRYIDWGKYVMVLPEAALDDIHGHLRSLPAGQVFALQNNIQRDRALFTREHCLKLLVQRLMDDCS